MDVIKMYATAERGNYFVSVVIDGEFVTGAQAIGPAPDKIRHICEYFSSQPVKVKSGPVDAIRSEMVKCGKFIVELK